MILGNTCMMLAVVQIKTVVVRIVFAFSLDLQPHVTCYIQTPVNARGLQSTWAETLVKLIMLRPAGHPEPA